MQINHLDLPRGYEYIVDEAIPSAIFGSLLEGLRKQSHEEVRRRHDVMLREVNDLNDQYTTTNFRAVDIENRITELTLSAEEVDRNEIERLHSESKELSAMCARLFNELRQKKAWQEQLLIEWNKRKEKIAYDERIQVAEFSKERTDQARPRMVDLLAKALAYEWLKGAPSNPLDLQNFDPLGLVEHWLVTETGDKRGRNLVRKEVLKIRNEVIGHE